MTAKTWANKIVRYGEVNPEDLLPNERNFRVHPQAQQAQMLAALDDVGWVQDVIVNLRTAEEWPAGQRDVPTMLDGHLRAKLALRHDIKRIPVKYVDLTPRQEAVALATLDAITGEATIDAAMLSMLLDDATTGEPALQELMGKMAGDGGAARDDGGDDEAKPNEPLTCPQCGYVMEKK